VPSLTRTAESGGTLALRVGGRHADCAPGSVRVVGRVPLSARGGTDCVQPLRAVCRECGHSESWRCDTYGCPPCGETKRRRLMRVIEDGSGQHLENGLHGYFVTLTAPGTRDHRRWYQGRRPANRSDCHCHLHGLTAGQWNRQESACWNRLRTAIARERDVIFAGAVETQQRGLLHRHVVLFADSPLAFEQVQQLAIRAGYGCVLDVEPLQSAKKAARYVAKYVTKSTSERSVVPWSRMLVNLDTGEVHEVAVPATFRLWSSSRRWGITMKQLKSAAGAQARARAMYLRELVQLLAEDAGGPDTPALADSPSQSPP
jgi:hypothetical protein